MSKFNDLFSKIEVFEKLSVYGDRSAFLQSLAVEYRGLSDSELVATNNAVKSAIQNWAANSAERQPDLVGGRLGGLPPGLRGPAQVVSSIKSFNVDTLPGLYQALLDLSTARNLGNMGSDAQNAWMKNVFPVLGTAMQKVKKQMDYLSAYTSKFQAPEAEPTQQAHYTQEPSAPTAPVAPAAEKPMADQAKSLANLLTNKVTKLPASKNRAFDLKNINENVKSLQRYFKALQHKNDMPSYFARMEIVKALQNAYSELDYNDLDIVSALNSGKGVPETPDSKI